MAVMAERSSVGAANEQQRFVGAVSEVRSGFWMGTSWRGQAYLRVHVQLLWPDSL
jgi:hypothetical protein